MTLVEAMLEKADLQWLHIPSDRPLRFQGIKGARIEIDLNDDFMYPIKNISLPSVIYNF